MATPDFILELRKHIGHDPLWLIGATAICLRDTPTGREVLLEKRTDDANWSLISGIVEPGEHPKDTLRREALEEVGARLEIGRMLWCLVSGLKSYSNGDQVRYLDHGYLGRVVGGELAADGEETSEVAWFPVSELPRPHQDRLPELIEIALRDVGDIVASLES